MNIINIFTILLIFILLTILTQAGGVIFIICIIFFKRFPAVFKKRWHKVSTFIMVYVLSTFTVIPFLAASFGRVPLPVFHHTIKPVNIGYAILNRHYTTPELKAMVERVALQMQQKYPDVQLIYLDANFPFWKGFPLLPHRSHHDGKQLDVTFYYKKGEKPTSQKPSLTGYGVFELPRKNERNQTTICKARGNWQYDINKYMAWLVRKDLTFDETRTRELIRLFARDQAVHRIFLEPHLKQRLRLNNPKIRFHGCRAARHDDHIHVEVY